MRHVAEAFCFEADERTGVSSGARIVKTSVKSSRLETAEPVFVVSNVFENDIIFKFYFLFCICKVLRDTKSAAVPLSLNC